MEQILNASSSHDFGGQNQIVNQQEQNREVNAGGLTPTDSEKSLNGPEEEKGTDMQNEPVKPGKVEGIKDGESSDQQKK